MRAETWKSQGIDPSLRATDETLKPLQAVGVVDKIPTAGREERSYPQKHDASGVAY
jgi:hypothetical protein